MSAIFSILPGLAKLGGKIIEDKDKRAEYAFGVQEMAQTMALKLLEVQTYPWVDALVKLAYAGEAIIKGLFRPLGAAAMTGFVIYAELNNIELSAGIEAILAGAFPAWGISRHQEKAAKKAAYEDDEW